MKNLFPHTVLKMLFIFLLMLFFKIDCFPQDVISPCSFDQNFSLNVKDSFKNEFGINKTIPVDIEKFCLVALSKYPALKDVTIIFRYRNISTTMSALPKGIRLNRDKRKYVININKRPSKKGTARFSLLSTNAKIGLIAHELGHILYYTNRSNIQLVWDGLRYMIPRHHREIEYLADEAAIAAGFGLQLYEFNNYLLNEAKIGKKYRRKKMEYYYSLQDLQDLIEDSYEISFQDFYTP